jgi:hypothetical protein
VSRQRQLLAEYGRAPVALAIYMTALFVDAVCDLPRTPAGELYQRFLGWIRH